MKKLLLVIAYLVASTSMIHAKVANEVKKEIDTDQSVVSWLGKKKVVDDKHTGKIKVKQGFVNFDGKGLPLNAELTIDMASITNEDVADKTYNQKLVGHLSNADFFDVQKYPISVLKINSFAKTAADKKSKNKNLTTYKASGDLQIKDKTEPVSFDVVINNKNKVHTGAGKLVIDRTRWGVKYGSDSFFKNLGDKVIANDIEFDFNIVTK